MFLKILNIFNPILKIILLDILQQQNILPMILHTFPYLITPS